MARIDAGDVQLEGKDGLIQQLIKAGLERGLQTELSEHVGYDKGDADAAGFPNSRNGSFPKTVSTSIGDVELAIPRDRNGAFTPMLVPKGSRRLSGLDDMIISLYAGGMTVRDIEHHPVSTIGTELSRETISKITDEVADEVVAWQQHTSGTVQVVTENNIVITVITDDDEQVRRHRRAGRPHSDLGPRCGDVHTRSSAGRPADRHSSLRERR